MSVLYTNEIRYLDLPRLFQLQTQKGLLVFFFSGHIFLQVQIHWELLHEQKNVRYSMPSTTPPTSAPKVQHKPQPFTMFFIWVGPNVPPKALISYHSTHSPGLSLFEKHKIQLSWESKGTPPRIPPPCKQGPNKA